VTPRRRPALAFAAGSWPRSSRPVGGPCRPPFLAFNESPFRPPCRRHDCALAPAARPGWADAPQPSWLLFFEPRQGRLNAVQAPLPGLKTKKKDQRRRAFAFHKLPHRPPAQSPLAGLNRKKDESRRTKESPWRLARGVRGGGTAAGGNTYHGMVLFIILSGGLSPHGANTPAGRSISLPGRAPDRDITHCPLTTYGE
jgi:hypothetical protein